MLPIEVPSNFHVIAHRGASAYAPENTLPAFSLAKKMGAVEVELDTQLSSDGIVVVCHDKTLKRYNHGDREVEKLTSQVLLKLDMGLWFSPDFRATYMTSLEQLLDKFSTDFIYNIELKGEAASLTQSVYEVVKNAGLLDYSIFTSFSYEQLIRMRKVSNDCRLGWLVNVESFNDRIMRQCAELALFQLCPRADLVTKEMVQRGHSIVSDIRAWGVQGNPKRVQMLISSVVDSGCDGMTINWPDYCIKK